MTKRSARIERLPAADWPSAIEAAYVAFEGYPSPRVALEVSSARENGEQMFADLTSAPLRELSYDKLTAFEGSALYTAGSLSDYKHFLPRLLELMVSAAGEAFYANIAAHKLNYAHFTTRPQDEVTAVRDVFRYALAAGFSVPPGAILISSLLEGNAAVGNALEPVLAGLRFDTAVALRNLAELVGDVVGRGIGRLSDADRQVLEAWVRSPAVAEALVNGIDLVAPDDLHEIENALFIVRVV